MTTTFPLFGVASLVAAGGSGTLRCLWQQSVDGGNTWTDVTGGSGGNSLSYTAPTLTETTKYRLRATAGNLLCDTACSNTATVTVLDKLRQEAPSPNQTICYNIAPGITLSGSAVSGGKNADSYSYQWRQSDDDGAFALWKYMAAHDKIGFLRFFDSENRLFLNFEKQDKSFNWYYNKANKNQYMVEIKNPEENRVLDILTYNISGIDKDGFIAVVPAHLCRKLSDLQQFEIAEDDNPVIITFEIEEK